MISWALQKDKIFSYLEEINRTDLLDGTIRILNREESTRWAIIIDDSVGLQCIPYALTWSGIVYTFTLEKSINIAPEYGLLIPGDKSYEDIISNHIEAEEDLSKSDFLKREYRDLKRWRKQNNNITLRRDEVAGLVIPLSLGGKETVKNRNIIDAEVNFSMIWQIARQIN